MPAFTTQKIIMSAPELPILNQVAGSVFAISTDQLKSTAKSPLTLSFSNAAPNLVTRFLNGKIDRAHIENYIKSVNSGTLVGMSVYVQQATDQSGNGNHAIQNTQANQPRIMNNGIWDVDVNGKVSPYYNGTSNYLSISNTDLFKNISGAFVIGVAQDLVPIAGANNHPILFASIGTSSSSSRVALVTKSATAEFKTIARTLDADIATNAVINPNDSNFNILSGIYNFSVGNTSVIINGVSSVASNLPNSGNTSNTSSQTITIGQLNTDYFNGKISEVIAFNRNLSVSEIQKLERNQSKRYKIAVS